MKRFALYLGLVTTLVASCSVQEEDFKTSQQDKVIYYASFEQPAEDGTRVYANEDLLLRWTADDRVSIFGQNTYNQQYKFLGETGDNSGSFSKVDVAEYVTGNPISHTVSVYPYQEGTRISEDEVLTITLPGKQHYAENTFGLGANAMVSVSEDNVLQYKNVGGYLRISLFGEDVSVSSITLKGNNGEKLAGQATVTIPRNGFPTVEMADDATTEITLICDTPVALGATAEESIDFWFVVPPTTFAHGFTVFVAEKMEGVFEKSTAKSVTIERSCVSKMSPIGVENVLPTGIILFADANFKAYCVENFDLDGDGEVSYFEAERVATINVNTERIQSLEGVEYFSNLESLICCPEFDGSSWSSSDRVWHLYDNEDNEVIGGLTSVDLSKNVLLKHLCVSGNQLTSLNISKNKALQHLDCSYNLLSSLDVLSNPDLTFLNCEYNNISELDVSTLPSVIELICTRNMLNSIDVSQNKLLKYFECDGNSITTLDLSNTTSLVDLNCSYNQLAMIDVSRHSSLWRLNCTYNKLSSLDVSHNPSLKYLKCAYNQISFLDVRYNPALSGIDCTSNNLTSIDASNNPLLSELQCNYNPITIIWLKRGQTISLFVYNKEAVTIKYIGPPVIPDAVDLGLPSGLKWASFNLGASKPEEYGDYYAWGEIEPYYCSQGPYTWKEGNEDGYWWTSYKWFKGSDKLIKYCPIDMTDLWGGLGTPDGKAVLDLEDDAAHVNLDGNWRMPTDDEWTELRENCTWNWTTQNGVNGRLVTGPNGNSIFLPAAGYRVANYLYLAGSVVDYWSSSLSTFSPYYSYFIEFDSKNIIRRESNRYYGFSVRPVTE